VAAEKILVIDAHPMVEEWVGSLIKGEAEVAFAGHAGGLSEVATLVARSHAALVLLEIATDIPEALEVIRSLKATCPTLRLLVFSSCDETSYALHVLRAGAHGYVSKGTNGEELLRAIRLVMSGGLYLSTVMIGHLAAGSSDGIEPQTGPAALLSERELQVFAFIGDGLKPTEIAQKISLSVKTVESYIGRIRQKLELKDSRALFQDAVKWSKTRGRGGINR
jgi:DNA-binding NarL/FixJ family response regulator